MTTAADAPEVTSITETGQAISELRKLEDGLSLAPEIVLSLAKAEESGTSQYVNEPVNPVIEDKIGTIEGEIFLESPSLAKFVVEVTSQTSEDSGSQEKPNLKEEETLKSKSTLQDNQKNESIEGENIDASDKEAQVHVEGENIKTEKEKPVTSSELATEEAIESTETTDDCTVGDEVGTFSEQVAVDLKGENAEVAHTTEFSTQENESAQVTNIHTEGLKIDNSVEEVAVSTIEEHVKAEDACQAKSSEPLAEEKLEEPVEATNSLVEGDDVDTCGKEVLDALPREHINPEVEKQSTASDLLTEEKTHEYVEVTDHLQLQEGDGADNSDKEVIENVTGENVKQGDEHLVKSLDLSQEERADESVGETDDLAEINKVDTSIPVDVQNLDFEDEQPVQSSEIRKKDDGTRSGEVETSGNEVQKGENVKPEDEQKANSTELITEEKLDEYVEVTDRPSEDEKQRENANPEDEKQAKQSESFTEEDNVEEQVQAELLPSSIHSDSDIPSREESGSFGINDEVNENISQNAGEFSEIKQEAAEENQETSHVIHSDVLKSTEATHDEPILEGIHASQSLKEEEKAINDLQTDETEGSKSCMDLKMQLSDESPQTLEEPRCPDQEASSPKPDHAEPSQERDVVIERESENMEEIIEKTREEETYDDSTSTGQNLNIKDEHIKSDSSEVSFQGELVGKIQEKPFDVAQVEKDPKTMNQDEGVENENPRESNVNSLATTSLDILNGGSDNTENEKKIPVTLGMEETDDYHKAETEEGEMPECTMARSLAQRSQEITEREMNDTSSQEDKLHDENVERAETGNEEDQEHSQPREESVGVKLEGAVEAVKEVPETGLSSTNDEAEGNEKEDTSSMNQEKSFEEESKEVQTKSSHKIEHEVPKEEVFEADDETTKHIIEDVAAVAISTDSEGEETVKESSKNNEVLSNEVCEGLEVNHEREEAEKLMKDGGDSATNLSTAFSEEETTGHSFHDDEMAKNQEEAKEHKETLEVVEGEVVAEEEITQTERNESLSNASISIPELSTEQDEHKETLEIIGEVAAEEEITQTEREETLSNASISIPDVSTKQIEERDLEQDENTTRQISSCISQQEDAGKANDETKHDVQVPASVTTAEPESLEYEVEGAKISEEYKTEGEPLETSTLLSKEHESKLIEENDLKNCEIVMDSDIQGEEVKIPETEQIMEDVSMRKEESANLKEANELLCEDIDGENQNEESQQTQTHNEEVAVSPDVALNNPYKEVDALPISHTLDEQTAKGVHGDHGEVSDIGPGKDIQGEDKLHPDVEELQLETVEMEKSTASANSDGRRTAEVEISDLIQTSETELMELTNASKGDSKSEDTRAHDNDKDEERSEEQATIMDFHQKGIEDEKDKETIIEEDSYQKNLDEESSFESEKEQKIVEEPEPELKEIDHPCKITEAEDRKIDAIQKYEEHDEVQTTNPSDDVEAVETEINNVQDISTESVGGQTMNESTGEDKKEEENPDGEVPEGLAKIGTTTDREEVIEDNCTTKDHDAQCTGEEADAQTYLEQTRTDDHTKEEEKKEEEEVKESELSSANSFRATIGIEAKDTGTEDAKDSNDNPSDFNATTEAAAEAIQRETNLKASEASIAVSAEDTSEETSEKAHDANSGSPRTSAPSVEETLSMKEEEQEDGTQVETSPHTSHETHSVLEEESETGSTTVVETEKLEETSDFNEYPTNETTIDGKSYALDVGEIAADGGTSSSHDQMASQTFQNKGTEGENLDEAQCELASEDGMINDTKQPIEHETSVLEAIEKLSDIEMVDKHIIDEEKIPLKQVEDVTSNEVHEADNVPGRNFEISESIEQNEIDTPGETHHEETQDALPVAESSEQEMKERDFTELTEASDSSEGKEVLRGEGNAHKLDTESLTVTAEKIESQEVVTEVQTILGASAVDFEEKRVEMLETNETGINVEKGTNLEISSVSHLPDEKADQKITDENPDSYNIGSVAETQKDAQEKDEEIENKEIHAEDRRAYEPNVDDENSKEIVEAVNSDENIETKDTENQEKVPNEASVSNSLVEEVSERETESKCEEALDGQSEKPAKDLEYESQQLHVSDINTEEKENKENEGIVLEHETAIPCSSGNSENKNTDKQPEEAEPRKDAEENQIEEIRKDNEGIQEETSTAEVSDELKTNTTIENTTQEVSEAEETVTQPCLTFSDERVNECDEEEKEQGERTHEETTKTKPEDQINENAIGESQKEKTHEATDPISYEEVQTELDNTHTYEGIEQAAGDEGLTRDTTLSRVEEFQEKHQELEKNEELVEMASGELKPEESKTILESEKYQDMKTDETDLTEGEVIVNREIKEVSEEQEKADTHEEIDGSIAEEKEALKDLYQVQSDENKAEETHQKEDLNIERVEEESSNLSSEYQNQEDDDKNINTRNEEINSSGSVVEKRDLERAGSSYETEGVMATGDESNAPPSENASEEEPKLNKEFKEISKIGHEEPITEIITTDATRTGTANEDRDAQKGLAEHEQINSISDLESSSTGASKDLQIKEVPTNNSDASIPEIPGVEGEITDSKEKLDFAFASKAIAEEREDNSKNEAPVEENLNTEENTQDVIGESKEQGHSISTQEETPCSTEILENPYDDVPDNAHATSGAYLTETTETRFSTGNMDIPVIQEEKGGGEVAKMEPDDQVQTMGEESKRVENIVTVEKEIIKNEHEEVKMNEEVTQMVSVKSRIASETIAEVGTEVIQEQLHEIEKNEETVEMVSGELKSEEPKTILEGEKDQDTKTDETDLTQAEVIMNREIEASEEQEKAFAHEEIDRSIAEEKEASKEHHQVQSDGEKAEETHQKEDLDIERVEEESSKLSSKYQNQEEHDRNLNARNEEINSSGSVVEAADSEKAGSSYETEGVAETGDERHAPTSENASEEEPKLSKEFEEIGHEEPITKIITTDESAKTGTANEDRDAQKGLTEHEEINSTYNLESSSTEESKNLQVKEDPENNSVASFPNIPEAESKIIDNEEKRDLDFAREAIAEVSQKREEREDNSKNEAPVVETLTTEESTQEICKNKEQGNDISMQGETPCGIEMLEKPSVDVTDNAHATSEANSTETTETKILTRIMDVPLNQEEKGEGVAAKTEPEDQVQDMATVGEETIQKEHQEVKQVNEEIAQMVSMEPSITNKIIAEFSQTMEEKEDESKNEAPPERGLMTQLITCEEERCQISQEEKTPSSIEALENPSNDATDDGLTPTAADSITTTNTKTSAGSRSISLNQEDQCEKAAASAEVIHPKHGEASEIKLNVKTVECEEKPAQDVKEGVSSSKLSEAENVPLSDLQQNTINETHYSTEPPAKNEETENKETPSKAVEEQTTGEEEKDEDVEENEEDEHRITDSGSDAPVMVDASRDIDVKPAPKKSHNLLSGMGSKVKHSIAKVKKAITGKSTHNKQSSPK